MEKTLLLTDGSFSIWKEQGIPVEAIEFLDSIAWGAEGAVYEHKNTPEHFKHITNPYLVSITEEEKMLGTAVFCNPQVTVAGKPFNYYYTRYFASSPDIRGRGVIKKLAIQVMSSIREGESLKTIFVGFVERGNKSSYKVSESAGYRTIGTIKTVGFSRFFPKKSSHIRRVATETERQEVLALLKHQYREHALVQFDYLFMHDNYYVIREHNEIVAGCQFHKAHWVVNKMPGVMGKMILKAVPKIPLLNKLFNPKKFEFLAFEGLYFKPGKEDRLQELFEGLLAQEKLKSALFWMAEKCPSYKALMNYGRFGLINQFVKDSDVYIMASYQNMTVEEIYETENSPLYASGFDYI
ncbi:MAG: GNAT family N-acetyltransferase [Chitinophagaceae bacterium]|nr:GNAT family N-acetyltransferase [Chitinophagaceae bacterium]MBL0131919.1 GNAT family N-acetyltransferase [Chitinophagaceae bacterium]MBL0273957.1 GNAT family N-acetyltransferase [Chitinophagaceae bacterium]